jgi:hypothetical protein
VPTKPLPRLLAWSAALTAAAAVCAAVFAAYLDPHLMLDLASRVWACF